MQILKKIVIFGAIAAVIYLVLAYHYIIIDNSVSMLKKSNLTLKYTVFSLKGKRPEAVLKIPELWKDGIGELLVKKEKISQEKLELYREQMEEEKYY
jgi:hypothetical protein